ncbi:MULTISPECIES: kynureninase [unclassified Halomonas]|uniref:kynureninase n=1 Tax=unclassified Halomonas TaxID=2609666 RepID=UPI0007D9F871|nr:MULTISPECIES: kynureninase [unclassified Halomonas]MBT2788226.1 kynureninase [Halomonas sp. ISL-106]MBT2795975.1 kynureninase [Halomonas sp. ISL-104]OAL61247.1 kynureninase [Halomonas sp. ALS9]
MPVNLDSVRERDRQDPLAAFKSRFALPEGILYLDGNSLGAQPKAAKQAVDDTLDQWRDELIKGWNQGWFDAPERLGNLLAPVIGAQPGEMSVTDNITLNIFKLLGYILDQAKDGRRVVLSEGGNFPTDGYIAQGYCRVSGAEHRFLPEGRDLAEHLNGVSVVVLSQVNYRTGKLRDMASTTKLVHDQGAEVIWDLAHSAGALPIDLNGCGVRYAVGCTYKYLNGGPGAPAFLYVHSDHQDKGWQPLSGWHGHASPFAFEADYTPAGDISRFRTGTHSALAYAALEASLALWSEVNMQALRDKSLAMSDLFRECLSDIFTAHNIDDITPSASERGSQVSLVDSQNGYAIVQALIARGVIGDYREPGLMRFGFTPLYLSFEDVWQAAQHFREVMESGAYQDPQFHVRGAVT